MQKKYLIFISSSQEDLKTERKELAKIITEMGAIPILLDEFDITEAKDRRIIHKIMQECDYFLNLTAHKGGKVVGKTFALELEYTYAAKAGVPVISLIIGEKARKKGSKKESIRIVIVLVTLIDRLYQLAGTYTDINNSRAGSWFQFAGILRIKPGNISRDINSGELTA